MDLTQQDQDLDGIDAGDAGAIVINWMTKLAITAAIIGVLGFDGIAVMLGHLSTADDANSAVQAASQRYESSHDVNLAFAAAKGVLKPTEVLKPTDFAIAADGTTTLSITNTVSTLVFKRTSQTAGLAVITAHATGKYTGS